MDRMSRTAATSYLLGLALFAAAGCAQPEGTLLELEEAAVEEVAALIDAQARAWSEGDIEGFVHVYAEGCTFLSPDGVTVGRQEVLDRYLQSYPDAEAMGALTLEIIEARPAVQQADGLWGTVRTRQIAGVSVAARWTLTYPDRPARSGLTLIVFRPAAAGGWEIVQDASFSEDPEQEAPE